MQNLKGMIWNVGGFRDTAKHLFVKESIREYKLDFIALLETGRSNFATPFLNQLAGPFSFSWFCLPPQGRSGGMLIGVNSDTLDVLKVTTGDFSVRMHMKCKRDGFEWNFVHVYGAAQDAQKPDFLAELVRMCDNQDLPMMVGGDFNIIRNKEENYNYNFNSRWPFMFN
jgi:exonuclease III